MWKRHIYSERNTGYLQKYVSPSIEVDYQTWKPVKDYIEKEMGLKHTDEEPIHFGEYDAEALNNIINQQRKICELQKKKTIKHYIKY